MRDLTTEISTAANVFQIRMDGEETRTEIRDIEERLANGGKINMASELRRTQTMAQQMYYSLGAISYLLETTHEDKYWDKVSTLDKELTAIRSGSLDLDMPTAKNLDLARRANSLGPQSCAT